MSCGKTAGHKVNCL